MAALTELKAKTVKPGGKPLTDGTVKGLRLFPGSEKGVGKWTLRFVSPVSGKRRDMGLGSYPQVAIAKAREKAQDARRQIDAGLDPIEARKAAEKAAKPVPTFREIAALVIADAKRKSVNAKVRYQWERHLGKAYSGALLDRPVNEITTVDVAAVLRPVWKAKPEVARKLYPAIRRVFDRARVILRDEHGVTLADNPARWSDMRSMGFETPTELTRGHHPSLAHERMQEFMAALRGREAVAALGLEFLILTNVRTDAVLKSKWPEFDLNKVLWTVPLTSLKDREHRTAAFEVPLSPRAVDILRTMERIRVSAYVFPGQKRGQPLSSVAFLTLLKRMNGTKKKKMRVTERAEPRWVDPVSGRPITGHGFRATFRTWAEEVSTFPHAAIEHAMGHKVGGKVERAYNRTTLHDMRRKLMDAWAAYCEPSSANEKVTPLRRKA
jgi:integrase